MLTAIVLSSVAYVVETLPALHRRDEEVRP